MQLSVPMGDGASTRVHLDRLRKATGRVDPQLAEAMTPLPDTVAPLWGVFSALAGARAASVEGVAPISMQDIVAWQQLQRVQLTPWEVDTLLQMDRAARSVPLKPAN